MVLKAFWGSLGLLKMPFDIFSTWKYSIKIPFDIPFDMARKAVAPYKSEPVLAPGPLLGLDVLSSSFDIVFYFVSEPLGVDFELPN